MTEATAAPELRLRRGSVVWRKRAAWLVYDVTSDTHVKAFPIRRGRLPRHAFDVSIEAPTEQLLTRVAGLPTIRTASLSALDRTDLQHAGELSGATMCKVSHALALRAAAQADEAKWADDRRHRRRADAEHCAV